MKLPKVVKLIKCSSVFFNIWEPHKMAVIFNSSTDRNNFLTGKEKFVTLGFYKSSLPAACFGHHGSVR